MYEAVSISVIIITDYDCFDCSLVSMHDKDLTEKVLFLFIFKLQVHKLIQCEINNGDKMHEYAWFGLAYQQQ